ncbi:MAG: hypothetical protein M3464_05565 [Chloroflexota bacterium]|nr:hypothetical protein [Chloroflexota bacterium]
MGIRQVRPWKQWPSGDSRPIAVLPYDLPELAERYGLKYQEGIDDLDRYRLAAIELANGEQAWLYKHANDPNPGTVAHVDAGSDAAGALSLLLDALSLDRDELLWAASVPANAHPATSSA